MKGRFSYWRRVLSAYLFSGNSQLTFWHERPCREASAGRGSLGAYYMTFEDKAAYPGPFVDGVPRLDYHGDIGLQFNPIAVAQYGLARFNEHLRTGSAPALASALIQADWLAASLRLNRQGVPVWMHDFDFEYRETLRAPWYSGLAQGQGLSLLARAWASTRERRYGEALEAAFSSFRRPVAEGGVMWDRGDFSPWIEEYIVDPPTHILNGCLWALWGLLDHSLATGARASSELFEAVVDSVVRRLPRFDTGYWSLYELSGTALPMLASPFYHRLHIVQLRITAELSGRSELAATADRWERYSLSPIGRARSLVGKCAFKALYY